MTRTQIALGIKDSVQQFYDDTLKSARDLARPELIKVLTYKSASAVEWLQDVFNLDLSLVSRLGGHSQPRTHRGKEMFPGMVITYALMEALEEIAENTPERAKILKKARVTKVLREGDTAVGVEYEYDGKTHKEYGPVVLATGGYAADFTKGGLLEQHRPDLLELSTTNGDHCTGDGQKMVKYIYYISYKQVMAIGGKGIDMDKVQVHPTGLVDPKDPQAKVKFLAAEALRGVGGLLIDAGGDRFIDELEKRDVVSNAMWKRDNFPVRLVLNTKATKEIQWHVKHYEGRGLMRHFKSGADLAKEMGIEKSKLEQVFKDYNDYASGKKKDPFGKKFFQNYPFEIEDEFHVALMEPVLHFTMGGVEIDDQARILIEDGKKALEGLWACGELAGGVHGSNRLGGSALLGCVVYGRVAGAGAANYLFQKVLSEGGRAGSAQSRLQQISLHIDPARPGRITVDWNTGGAGALESQREGHDVGASSDPSSSSGNDSGKAKKPAKKFEIPDKEFSLEDIAKHNTKDDCWVAVNGMALNVTDFLENHPGGPKAILLYAGKDATEEFNMLHDKNVVEVSISSRTLLTFRNTHQRQFRAESRSKIM